MNYGRDVKVWGAVTALYEIMETAWVSISTQAEDPTAVIQAMREKMLSSWEMPARVTPESEEYYQLREQGRYFLQTFWERCEDRVRDIEAGKKVA